MKHVILHCIALSSLALVFSACTHVLPQSEMPTRPQSEAVTLPTLPTPGELKMTPAPPPPADAIKSLPSIPGVTLVYLETIGYGLGSGNRASSTIYRLLKKDFEHDPELIGEIGGYGEYPTQYVLSADHKKIIIPVERAVKIVDLVVKKIIELPMTPKGAFHSAVFSPDETKLLVWDQKYASEDDRYAIHEYVFATGESKIIKEGNTGGVYYSLERWRQDNKVVAYQLGGEFINLRYFDRNDLQMKPSGHTGGTGGTLSASGNHFAHSISDVDDTCNELSGSAPGLHEVIDPVTGKSFGTIGDKNKALSIVAIAPNEDRVLYALYSPPSDRTTCDPMIGSLAAPKTYFTESFPTGGNKKKIDDYQSIVRAWKTPSLHGLRPSQYYEVVAAYDK